MTLDRDDQIADLITARALNPALDQPGWVTDQEWDAIAHLAAIERDLHDGAVAPDLREDPTAAMLGLVADPAASLDRKALTRLRKAAKLTASDLASRLVDRGWDVTQREIFQWENQNADDVPPALIDAISAVLSVPAGQLTTARVEAVVHVDTHSPKFQALVARMSQALRINMDLATSRLTAVAAVSVHRGDKPTDDHLMDTLDAYVRAMESRSES